MFYKAIISPSAILRLWGNLVSLRGLGPCDPGSNPGSLTFFFIISSDIPFPALHYRANQLPLIFPKPLKRASEKSFRKRTMAKKVKFTGGWGPRYGRKIRQRVISTLSKMKQWQECPYCKKARVKRSSYGIWHCQACDSTFTGKAYEV